MQKKKKKSLFILQDLNNLQISELKNVEEEKLSSEKYYFSSVNQNYGKILQHDWLSPAQFEN